MKRKRVRCLRICPVFCAIVLGAAGCQGQSREAADLGPPGLSAATAALRSSLDAWKSGQRASGVIIGSKPAIGIVDATTN